MKKILLILLCLPFIGFGQNVNIPDANFKANLKNIFYNTQTFTSPQVQWQLDSTLTSDLNFPVSTYKYDTQGNLIESVTMSTIPLDFVDSAGNIFYSVEGFKYIYQYDVSNNPINFVVVYINGAAFDTSIHLTFTWNANNQVIEQTQFKTNFAVWLDSMIGGELGYNNKTYYSYNTSNEMILTETFDWDGSSHSIPIGKSESSYQSGNLVLTISYNYNVTYWDTSAVSYYTWSNGNKIMHITPVDTTFFHWSNGNHIMQNTNADTTFFNYNSIPLSITTSMIWLVEEDLTSQNQIIDKYDNQGNTTTYYYSSFLSSTDISDIFNNKSKLVKVTDLLGRETKQTNQPLFYIYDDGTVEKRIVIE